MKLPKELTTVTPLSKYLAMVVFVSLPFIGFFLGMRYQQMLDLAKRQEMKVNLSIPRSPTPTPTANWKTYVNTKYDYSLKYPNSSTSFVASKDSTYVEIAERITITILHHDPIACIGCPKLDGKIENTTINNLAAKQIVGYQTAMGKNTSGQKFQSVIIPHRGYYYQIVVYEHKLNDQTWESQGEIPEEALKLFNQILSTFKFLDGEENNQQLGDAATKKECLAKGGVWQKWGLAQLEYCQIPSQDAGKSCTDSSQCTYKCISTSGKVPGKCVTYKNTYGCFSIIENGKAQQTLCAD